MKLSYSHRKLSRRAGEAGLTLIELLVVLIILVGVAGILVPLFPDVQQRTHGATGADNIKEVAKALQLHKANTGSYPDGLDALIDETPALAIEDGGAGQFAMIDLSSDPNGEVIGDALLDGGISTLEVHDSAATNATFEPYNDTQITIVGGGTPSGNVVTLTAAGEDALGLENSGTDIVAYVMVGVGARSTAIGETMLDAPVHYLEGESPIEEYARWLAIFAVPAEGPLQLVSVAGNHDGELGGLGGHLNEYYESLE